MISAAFTGALNPRTASETSASTQLGFILFILVPPFWFVGATHLSPAPLHVVAPVDEIRSSDIELGCFSVKIARDQANDQKSNKQCFFDI
jgi:hypothetical protein